MEAKLQQISLTPKQRKLVEKHGTPAEFAQAVYKCVPGDINMDEARASVEKYSYEWKLAGMSVAERRMQAAEDEVKRLSTPDMDAVRQVRTRMAQQLVAASQRNDLTVPEALEVWRLSREYLEGERPRSRKRPVGS